MDHCALETQVNEINHAVLVVGWTANGDWIIKNSWGK